jgi:hypothetical protein
MKTTKYIMPAIVAACFTISVAFGGYTPTGSSFIEPAGWSVGDSGSTSQTWDALFVTTGNLPDAGFYTVNPAIATQPTLNVSAPGFTTGSQNFYSFTGDYPVFANIYNHGTGGSDGTHVIVQTAATLGGLGDTVLADTLEIVDSNGNPLTGGANAAALVDGGQIFLGTVNSSFGVSTLQVLIWEFFLPGHTGDFQVKWTEQAHSSLDQVRIDSMIAPSAFAPSFAAVPEPASLTLVGACMLGLALKRSRG